MLDGEKDIIKRAISGEASAFGLLYDKYQPQIYRFIYLKVSHREEAEDLTHQVFLKSWERIDEYKPQGFPFSAWLYRIARNLIVDHYRLKKNNLGIDEAVELKIDDPIALTTEKKLDIEKVKKAVNQLSPKYQDVIILRFIEELSPKETASILNKTEISVRMLQYRAIKNLKKILNE
jgi:RNA polymerase sigma-70 factor (ECF subfamily)